MTDIDIAAIEPRDLRLMERLHTKGQIDGQDACTFCDHLWPCDAAVLLAALRAAKAREAKLTSVLIDCELRLFPATDDGPSFVGDRLYQRLRRLLGGPELPPERAAPTEPEAER